MPAGLVGTTFTDDVCAVKVVIGDEVIVCFDEGVLIFAVAPTVAPGVLLVVAPVVVFRVAVVVLVPVTLLGTVVFIVVGIVTVVVVV